MIKKYLTAFILSMAAWYAFLASRSLEKTAEYAFRDVYEIGDKILISGGSGSGSYIDVDIFGKSKLPAWKSAMDSNDYRWLDTNAVSLADPLVLEAFPEGIAFIGDFDFDGVIEAATIGSDNDYGRSVSTPLYIGKGGEFLEMNPFLPKAIFTVASITHNYFFFPFFLLSCLVTILLWFIALLGRLFNEP